MLYSGDHWDMAGLPDELASARQQGRPVVVDPRSDGNSADMCRTTTIRPANGELSSSITICPVAEELMTDLRSTDRHTPTDHVGSEAAL
jgi:bifunctional ADP-heptose synthase (sugar kinase/adenylyltransferase)